MKHIWFIRAVFIALCLAGLLLSLMEQGIIASRPEKLILSETADGILTVHISKMPAVLHVRQDGHPLRYPYGSIKALSAAPDGGYVLKGNRLYIKSRPKLADSFVLERRKEPPVWAVPLVFALAVVVYNFLIRSCSAPAITTGCKLPHLNGLRGCACTVVLLCHAYNASLLEEAGKVETVTTFLRVFPFGLFISGGLAVEVFFVLSGFVLALPYISGDVTDRLKTAIFRRPIRLLGLLVPAMIGAHLLGYSTVQVDQHTFLSDLFTSPFSRGQIYDPPLWTIVIELYGSLGLFIGLWLTQGMGFSRRIWFYAWAAIMLHGTSFMGFIAGSLFAECASRGMFPLRSPGWIGFASVTFATGLWLGVSSNMASLPDNPANPILAALNWVVPFSLCGAIFIVFGALNLGNFAAFLNFRGVQFLGRVSYATYVAHWMVLYSVGLPLISWLKNQIGLSPILAWSVAVPSYVALTTAVALAATIWIDDPAIRASKWLAKRVAMPRFDGQAPDDCVRLGDAHHKLNSEIQSLR